MVPFSLQPSSLVPDTWHGYGLLMVVAEIWSTTWHVFALTVFLASLILFCGILAFYYQHKLPKIGGGLLAVVKYRGNFTVLFMAAILAWDLVEY